LPRFAMLVDIQTMMVGGTRARRKPGFFPLQSARCHCRAQNSDAILARPRHRHLRGKPRKIIFACCAFCAAPTPRDPCARARRPVGKLFRQVSSQNFISREQKSGARGADVNGKIFCVCVWKLGRRRAAAPCGSPVVVGDSRARGRRGAVGGGKIAVETREKSDGS